MRIKRDKKIEEGWIGLQRDLCKDRLKDVGDIDGSRKT